MNLPKSNQVGIARFPKNNSNRSFVKEWLINYFWLEYNISSDRAFCHTCRVFTKLSCNTESSIISSGYNNWMQSLDSNNIKFLVDVSLQQFSFNQECSRISKERPFTIQVKINNRKHLHAIIEICRWLAKQGV